MSFIADLSSLHVVTNSTGYMGRMHWASHFSKVIHPHFVLIRVHCACLGRRQIGKTKDHIWQCIIPEDGCFVCSTAQPFVQWLVYAQIDGYIHNICIICHSSTVRPHTL